MAPVGVEYTKWIITGIAAIVAVILASLDSISKHVALGFFKWGTALLVVSLLSGSLAYLLSLSLAAGVESRKRAEKAAENPDHSAVGVTPALLELFKGPFWGPMRLIMNRSFRKAVADPLYVEKSQIWTVCLLNVLILSTIALAASGMTVFVVGFGAGAPVTASESSSGQKPNKAPEPTPGSVTPRATEGK
jgi:hypothetical protein